MKEVREMDIKEAVTKIIAEPGRQEMVISRTFDAPAVLLYRALTEPELIEQWWGPRRFITIVDKDEVRYGGAWRFINRDAQGNEYGFHGVYHEVTPTRITWTFEFEGMPGHISLETVTLDEHDGKTDMTAKSVHQSVEDRDGNLAGGMAEGVKETYDRLAELLEKLKRE